MNLRIKKINSFFLVFLLCGYCMAHVPVITPADHKNGNYPPKLEPKPLPPLVVQNPTLPGVFVLLWPNLND